MASFMLSAPIIAIGDTNLTTSSNQIALSSEFEQLDATTFSPTSTWRTYVAGLASSSINISGFYSAGNDGATPNSYWPDDGIWPNLGTSNVPLSVTMGSSVGDVAYFMTANELSYQFLGNVGELAPFSISATGTRKVIRGAVGSDPYTNITATSSAASVQLTAVSSTQYLWANLHVFAASGTTPSLTVKVQSDDNSGFTSATDRITFTAASTKTSEAKSLVGPITDTYWRANYTVSGTSPKFLALVTFGIG